jgi:ABC-2 type transport system ATP-binding protein
MNALATRQLRKDFGDKTAVRDLTLTVRQGEVFGFLGPNGAGKTTSVKMLLGLVQPTSGDGELLGRPLGDIGARAKVGFLPEHFRFHDWLTGRELLRIHGRLLGLTGAALAQRIEKLLHRVDLTAAADRMVRTYSKGMTQRVGMAQALLNEPRLVFFDEPTSGLDPLGRLLVRDVIAELKDSGASVFLNSHLLSEVEVTCDRVAFVKAGQVIREMSLREGSAGIEVELRVDRARPALLSGLAQFGEELRGVGDMIYLKVPDEARVPEITRWLVEQGVPVFGVAAHKRSLEALFLEVMGEARPG